MIRIVADTNIWLSEKIFKSSIGVNLIYFLRVKGGKLILPEIIKMELIPRIKDEGKSTISKLETTLSLIQVYIGSKPKFEIPESDEFVKSAMIRFQELKPVIEEQPLDLKQCKEALNRAIHKIPPCKNREEIRDALLWEATLKLAKENPADQVKFISSDRDFKDKNEYSDEIIKEAEAYNIELVYKLGDILEEWKKEGIDDSSIWEVVEANLADYNSKFSELYDFTICYRDRVDLQLYATENIDVLSFEFTIRYHFENFYDYNQTCQIELGYIEVAGDGLTNLMSSETSISVKYEEIYDDSGLKHFTHYFLRGSTREDKFIPYSVRAKLP